MQKLMTKFQSPINTQKLLGKVLPSKKVNSDNKVISVSSKPIHAQSAIEYLTTYGWAILLIAIALVSLYELGVFNRTPPTQCIIEAGFSCSNFYLTTNGVLVFNLNQQTINPINITGIACYENATLLAGQKPYNPPSNQIFMPIGNSETLYAQCFTSNTVPYSGNIGSVFIGSIAIYYTDAITHFTELASGSLTVPVTSTASIQSQGNADTQNSILLTVTDTTSLPIIAGFQQMLKINPSTFSQYGANANLSNLEFTTGPYGSGVPIQAWIESGASNTATSSIIWLNLPSEITSNGGTESVYMNFLSNNNPVTQGYTGYAPQLWCASGCFQTGYAQYDDGASVFNFYDNFAGTSLNTNKWVAGAISGGVYSIDNGITIPSTGGSIFSSSTFSQGILEFYGYFTTGATSTGMCQASVGLTRDLSSANGYTAEVGYPCGYGFRTMQSWAGTFISGLNFGANNLYSIIVSSTSPTSIEAQVNYGDTLTSSSTLPVLPLPIGIINQGSAGIKTGPIYYVRFRAYPPNGVMPSVSCSYGTCSN